MLFRVRSSQVKCTFYKLIKSLLHSWRTGYERNSICIWFNLLCYIASYLYSHWRPTCALNYRGLTRCHSKHNSCFERFHCWKPADQTEILRFAGGGSEHLSTQNGKPRKICLGKKIAVASSYQWSRTNKRRIPKILSSNYLWDLEKWFCEWKNAFNSKTEPLFSQPCLWCCFWLPGLLNLLTSLFNRFDLCVGVHLSEMLHDHWWMMHQSVLFSAKLQYTALSCVDSLLLNPDVSCSVFHSPPFCTF